MEPMDVNPSVSSKSLPDDLDPLTVCVTASCEHLEALKNEDFKSTYELLFAYYVVCIGENAAARKVKDCVCHKCEKKARKKSSKESKPKLLSTNGIHACMSCRYFGCSKGKCHISAHSKKKNHLISLDVNFGEVYCFECGDYKYDNDFIEIGNKLNAIARSEKSEIKSPITPISGNPVKWEPSPDLVTILNHHDILHDSEIDVRGIVNIGGYTCYLNVCIQVLLHAPIFRDYLLSSVHDCKSDTSKGREADPCTVCHDLTRDSCMLCEMANVLQESLAPTKKPFAIPKIFCNLVKRCHAYGRAIGIDSYQDAYDCFKDLLINFHEDETGPRVHRNDLYSEIPPSCSCVIHKMFGFEIEQEKKCQSCMHVSVNKEFHTYINLHRVVDIKDVTLIDCLQSTWREELTCDACKSPSSIAVSKPISLPYILPICSNQLDYKLNMVTYLKFEETLDLSPYIVPSWKSKCDSQLQFIYYLFAIVEYKRNHYKCYIRKKKDKWFMHDDLEKVIITPISVEEVMNVNVRYFFYHKMYM